MRWTVKAAGRAGAVLLAASLSPHASSAHDMWLSLSGDAPARRIVVNYGHPDDRPPAALDEIVDLVAIDREGQKSILAGAKAVTDNGVGVVTSQPFADNGRTLFAARYDNGFWITTAEGISRNVTRRLASDVKDSVWSGKFAKAISGAGAPWDRILGHDLEIVPLSDPGAIRPGGTLKVRVLFRGQPLAGADVERGDSRTIVAEKDIPRYRVDEQGIASIPIDKPGVQLLVVDHKVRPSAALDQANADMFNGTFWFSALQ